MEALITMLEPVGTFVWAQGKEFLAFCVSEPMIMLGIGLTVLGAIVAKVTGVVRGI